MDMIRKEALEILIEYDRSGTYPNLALKSHLRKLNCVRDKKFITALVYGVIEKRLLLDYYIAAVSSIKLSKINIVVTNILRMGLYQIIFMSIPKSAACNTSVNLAKNNGQYKSAGFINAILRKLSDTYTDIKLPSKKNKQYYSVKYSISDVIVNKLISTLGENGFERFMECADKRENSCFIVVNTLKTDADSLISILIDEGLNVSKTSFNELIKINGHFDVEHSQSFKRGLYHVIGYPSYIAAKSIDPKSGEEIFDMCAAPGGKTFAIYNLSKGKAHVTAFDLHKHKTDNIKKDCERLGFKNIDVITADSSLTNDKYLQKADKILCDVPCSGLGMIFKKPDIKYNDINFETLVTTQLAILKNAADYLKVGGKIVYSTCTVNYEENRGLIDCFLKNDSRFALDDTEIYDGNVGDVQFLPDRNDSDGFYIAVLKKIY